MMKKLILGLAALMALTFVACDDSDDPTLVTVDFEDITLDSMGYWNGADGSGSITSGALTLTNTYNTDWFSWNGFSISNQKNDTTPGWGNQYSCIAKSGASNSENFALFFPGWGIEDSTLFSTPINLSTISFCNSTYAYLYMLNGDGSNDKFGGLDGSTEDYLKLNISLYNINKEKEGTEELYLADFRNGKKSILKEWKEIDFSTYEGIKYLKFTLESSDPMAPTYFCIDNITYYEAE